MRRRAMPSLALVALLAGCSARQTASPPPPAAAPGRAARVVLVSLDGLAATRQRELIRRGAYREPDGLAGFEGRGFVVDQAVPVDPPLTAVSHAAIASGALPAATGIVSNVFHLPGTPLTRTVSGFDAPWQSDSLWQAFHRQGKRVGVLLFPGCDGAGPTRTADFGMLYVTREIARPHTERLAASRFVATDVRPPAGLRSYSPARTAPLTVSLRGEGLPGDVTFHLTAFDTSDDHVADWDTLVVDDDADPGNGVIATVRAGDWFALRVAAPAPDGGTRTVGAWCLLGRLPAELDGVELYIGSFNATLAYPRSFRERLEATAGFWPGVADDAAVARALAGEPGLSPDAYLAQTRRFSEYLDACFAVAVETERFDLLLAYQPIVDEAQHAFTLTDPRQRDFSPGLAATAAQLVDDVYGIADRAVAAMARALDLRRDALVVVSDHGIAPAWETVYVNEVLRRAGLLEARQGKRGEEVAPASRVAAVTSGGVAHLYVNLAGREVGGVVPAAEREGVVRAAAQALALVEIEGVPAVETMLTREEAGRIGLDSANAGDLIAFFTPGFVPSARLAGVVHEPSEVRGQHGFRNTHAEMAAVWLARGAGVPRRRVARLPLTEVAAFVAGLAGVEPPRGAAPFAP